MTHKSIKAKLEKIFTSYYNDVYSKGMLKYILRATKICKGW